jgi:phosphatidylcholine synthase
VVKGMNKKRIAYLIHFYTASGIVLFFLSIIELTRPEVDVRLVFCYLFAGVFIDATDGPLARYCNVSENVPHVSGRLIDDIVDYVGFTFVPLVMVWRMGWVDCGGGLDIVFVSFAMISSLFGFANTSAKDDRGFFLGFPSYWNVYAFYAGILFYHWGGWLPLALLVTLSVLTVLPVRFVYPNKAPGEVRFYVIGGGVIWSGYLLYLLPAYPHIEMHELIISLVYPLWYVFISQRLSLK